MKNLYKAVVSDLDGTLLNENHTINKRTIETIKKVISAGKKFYIATGRNYSGAKEIMEKINLEIPLITSNGARILDSEGKEIYIKNIDKNILDNIYKIDYKKIDKNIKMFGYSGSDWYVTEDVSDYLYKINPNRKNLPEVLTFEDFKTKEYTKIFFSGEHEKLLELEKKIEKVINNEVNMVFVSEKSLEIFSKESNKAIAAKYLLEKDGLTLKDAIAFGDGYNDYEMLKEAGKGYLMENSLYRLKESLPEYEMIGKNSEDAVAKKLEEIFLI